MTHTANQPATIIRSDNNKPTIKKMWVSLMFEGSQADVNITVNINGQQVRCKSFPATQKDRKLSAKNEWKWSKLFNGLFRLLVLMVKFSGWV